MVVAAAGIIGGVVATGGGPTAPALYTAGIAEWPCAPGQAVAVPVSTSQHFLPDSSVLSGEAQSSCTPAAVAASTNWLSEGTIPGGSAAQRELATRALLDLRLSVQANGAVVAGFYPGWDYDWPRDTSFVIAALAATGHSSSALSALRFLQRMQNPDGTWAARYYPDSGPVQDGRPAELDAVGWVPWAVWSWAAAQRAVPRAELAGLWPMVAKAADAAMASIDSDGLPEASMDYWEDEPIEQTLGTAAALLAGLRASAALAGMLSQTADQATWRTAAASLESAITRTFGKTGYQRTPGGKSGADAAVTFLGPPFADPSAAVIAAANSARRQLTEPNGGVRPGTAWPGAAGVSFTAETAMFGLFDAGTGQQAAADQVLSWLDAHRTTLGELPEQVAANGKPISVAPLAWTDAIVLLTLQAQSRHLPVVP